MKRTFILGLAFVFGLSVVPAFAAGQGSSRIHEVQQALKDKGFDPGPIDGKMGSQTRDAIKKYEEQNNLTADGRVNSKLMDSLGVDAKASGGNASSGNASAPGPHMDKAGTNLKKSYSKGGSDLANGGKSLGKDVKKGEVGNGAKSFGKDIGKGFEKMGKGTGKAAKNAYDGTKAAVVPSK